MSKDLKHFKQYVDILPLEKKLSLFKMDLNKKYYDRCDETIISILTTLSWIKTNNKITNEDKTWINKVHHVLINTYNNYNTPLKTMQAITLLEQEYQEKQLLIGSDI